ncbi:MAG: bifunctional [glutamine synthetase] adenylyltransferase/[glutamine synthetase]-adenylyl-L-tyrosine phosphorylase, partial [Pseudomonadota bacterium]
YYETYGQNWERAAFIKARPVAGDFSSAVALLTELEAYVWRKYFDFASVADVHAMKRQINTYKGFREIAVRGHDVKLGLGGIREIEFFVQTQQLIAGGRQPELRDPRTLHALDRLVKRRWITSAVRDDLAECYRTLREIEHRVQMVVDAQTHLIPKDEDAFESLALFCGFDGANAFERHVRQTLLRVREHYAALFEDVDGLADTSGNLVFAGEADDPETLETLAQLGFKAPQTVLATVRGWHHGRNRATESERARESLTEFQPTLIEALARTGNPDEALIAFDRFLGDLPAGVQLFSLLRNNPNLLRLLADIMGSAPRLARVISRRARTFEAILDPGFFGHLPDSATLDGLIDTALEGAEDHAARLDAARVFAAEFQLLVGVRLLAGTIDAREAGEIYALLADALIERMLVSARQDLSIRHGTIASGQVAVLGMGKLGGREMTAASDVDLILIYDHAQDDTRSDGDRPLMASQYFARLTQRLVTALSSPTAEGALYEVDMRLRPSGNAGPVATRLSAFETYQARDAWTWEHMALLRSRAVAGDVELCCAAEAARLTVLTQPRDRSKLVRDVREMRDLMAAERASTSLWDLKLVRGGLVDIEFIVQFLQLAHGAAHPDCLARSTRDGIAALGAVGALEPDETDSLARHLVLLETLTQLIRLCAGENFEPSSAPEGLRQRIAEAIDSPNFSHVEARLQDAQADVLAMFEKKVSI